MTLPETLRAVVTGGSSGIGRATALLLGRSGAHLHLPGRRVRHLEETARAVEDAGGRADVHSLDLVDPEAVVRWVRGLELSAGLDLVMHAAGAIRLGNLEVATTEDFRVLFAVNVEAPFLLTRELLPALRRARGQVAFVNSTSGRVAPRGGFGLYAATKHALRCLAEALRSEENRHGVRVVSVFPGRTATAMQESIVDFEGGAFRPDRLLQPEDVARAVVDALSLPRTAEVTEIAVRPFLPPS